MNKKVKLIPASYYKAVYACNGNVLNEEKFDSLAGLKWVSKYIFEIVDEKKWESFKKKYEIELDKQ